jgi:hypothetical protein
LTPAERSRLGTGSPRCTVVIDDASGKIVQRSIEPNLSDLQAAFRRIGVT